MSFNPFGPVKPGYFIGSSLLLAVAFGCVEPVSPPPTVMPTSTPLPQESWPGPTDALKDVYSDSGFDVAGGSLSVQVKKAEGPISGARIRIYGPTLASGTTNARGEVSFAPLAEGKTYRLVADAEGMATVVQDNLTILRKSPVRRVLTLLPEQRITGRVTDGRSGLAHAVISDGVNTTTSDATGAFTLQGVSRGSVTLHASIGGKKPVTMNLEATGGQQSIRDLIIDASNRDIYFDPSTAPGALRPPFERMKELLRTQGYNIVTQAPDKGGVWFLITPSIVPPSLQILPFVREGGRVIMCGEWGGYAGVRIRDLNLLAHAFGVHFNTDLVRDPTPGGSQKTEWLTVRNWLPGSPVTRQVGTAAMYQSGSLFGLSPVQTLALSSTRTFRIQNVKSPSALNVLMGGTFGAGRVTAVGDASLWSDDDTDGNGTINLMEADNRRLLTNLLDW